MAKQITNIQINGETYDISLPASKIGDGLKMINNKLSINIDNYIGAITSYDTIQNRGLYLGEYIGSSVQPSSGDTTNGLAYTAKNGENFALIVLNDENYISQFKLATYKDTEGYHATFFSRIGEKSVGTTTTITWKNWAEVLNI